MAFKLGMKVDLCMGYNVILMVVSMTLTLMHGHSGSADKQIQLWIISTTKQAIKSKLFATVGHDKFYISLKSSVPVVLNYGHTSASDMHGVWSAFRTSFWCNFIITLACHLDMTYNVPISLTVLPTKWRTGLINWNQYVILSAALSVKWEHCSFHW